MAKNLLTPQIKAKELMLNPDFVGAITDKNYARVGKMIADYLRLSYLEVAESIVENLENDLIKRKVIDKSTINNMKDQLKMVRLFHP